MFPIQCVWELRTRFLANHHVPLPLKAKGLRWICDCLKMCKREEREFGEKCSESRTAERQQRVCYQHGAIEPRSGLTDLQRSNVSHKSSTEARGGRVSTWLLPKGGKNTSRLEVQSVLQHLLCEALGWSLGGRWCISQGISGAVPCAGLLFYRHGTQKAERCGEEHSAGGIKCESICFTLKSRL